MNFSALFIRRPVATTLLTLAIALAGAIAFLMLPVSPLPQVDFPTIMVQASLPGASPDTMAATVATPLERSLGRIAGITEMTSASSQGSTRITLQFDLSRNIDGAARDVQAAINASRSLLPTSLPSNPTYRKMNPADAPVMIIALTSDTLGQPRLYDAASTILAQKIAQIEGVGQVLVGGSSLPAVRVQANPNQLNQYGIGMEAVRTAIASANANRPKGNIEDGTRNWQVYANDQLSTADQYKPVIVSYKNGAAVRLSDVATVTDSVQDSFNAGYSNGKTSVLLVIFRQPGANIIETVDRVKAQMPTLKASIPKAIDANVMMERTRTIRGSLREVERALVLSIGLVVMVVFLFLRNARATLIPAVAVPVSLIGTFGVMYLCGFSLNNLSLMALTVATGFVVDDAIVVLENISRYLEEGLSPMQAALKGAREVSFTVISISISLIAVFIPILMMGGIIGRLFREFAITLSVAIIVSLLISLTTTPMMCARLLKTKQDDQAKPQAAWLRCLFGWCERFLNAMTEAYARSLKVALRHQFITLLILVATIGFNVFLYYAVPKGFFPQQDTGSVMGGIQADQGISFLAMREKLERFIAIVKSDPDVENVVAFTGGDQTNSGRMFISLKPLGERKLTADQVIARLRGKLASEPGASLFMQSVQDIRIGGRMSNAQYQFTLQSEDLSELRLWEPKVLAALKNMPQLADVNSDQQDKGHSTYVTIDRDTASRLGITPAIIDGTLNDHFGQRLVSTIYAPLNQYRVVLEVAPEFRQSPEALQQVYFSNGKGNLSPLPALARYAPDNTPLAVNHQGQFAASTISFNLKDGYSLSDIQPEIKQAMQRIGLPDSIQAGFQGAAKAFQASMDSQLILMLTALLAVYIVLGVLYESYIHPLTILSTLPSAGVGAILALFAFRSEFNIIALIGVILLIGIVKKNAIMMIDFAITAEREHNLSSHDAIYQACQLRFRPIMMTTMAALLGAVPLVLGAGDGAELRRPLGISIVGGLIMSQILTLYTTPVVYLYMDRLSLWYKRRFKKAAGNALLVKE